ncbi:hypothetical protein ACJX0J_026067, partial [Zea mays]
YFVEMNMHIDEQHNVFETKTRKLQILVQQQDLQMPIRIVFKMAIYKRSIYHAQVALC